MDFSSNIDLIIRDLTEVCAIIDDLKHYPGVPSFQVEIAKSKCRSAAELIALLKHIRDEDSPKDDVKFSTPLPVPERKPGEIKKTLPVQEVRVTPSDFPVFELSNEVMEPEHAEKTESVSPKIIEPPKEKSVVEEVKMTEIKEIKEIKVEPTEKKEPGRSQDKASAQSIIADRFSPVSGSLYEQIGKTGAADEISEKILTKPVSSLTEAIGVNDRFLFIREFFKGNKEAYLEAIERLDNTKNFGEALSVVKSFTDPGEDIEAVRNLLRVIKRKHPSNE